MANFVSNRQIAVDLLNIYLKYNYNDIFKSKYTKDEKFRKYAMLYKRFYRLAREITRP